MAQTNDDNNNKDDELMPTSQNKSENNQQAPPKVNVDNIEPKMQSQIASPQTKSIVRRIDEQLCIYYQQHGLNDYWDNDRKCGKFTIWCEDNEFDTDMLVEEINGEIEDAMFADFDEHFPFKLKIDDENKEDENKEDENKKIEKIFKHIKNLYESRAELNIENFSLYVSVKDMKETLKIYQTHIKTWGSEDSFTQLTDINILYFLTLSRMYQNQNLLLNLIDSCKRDIMLEQIYFKQHNKMIDTDVIHSAVAPEDDKLENWISKRLFLKQLHEAMQQISNKWNPSEVNTLDNKTTKARTTLDLKSIIKTYPKRMGQRLSPLGCRLMDGNLRLVAKYIVASSKFLSTWIEQETKNIGGPPFLFDFIILSKPSKSGDVFKVIDHRPANTIDDNKDSGDDDDDPDYPPNYNVASPKHEYDEDIIPNPIDDLKSCDCKFHKSIIAETVTDEELFELVARKNMVDALRELRGKLNKTKKTYPQNHRFIMIIDPRKATVEDDLIVFEPPEGSNKLSDVNIPECYFDLSRQCLIPRKGYIPWDDRTTNDRIEAAKADKEQKEKLKTQTIDATQAAQGQILTFSYHVRASDEIKCYLLWNGRCHRFYPQDILELLPHLFVKNKENVEFAKSDEIRRLIMAMEITDTQFELFYRGLNRLRQFEFPKQYYVPNRKYPLEPIL